VFGGTLVSVASFGMLQQRRWNDRARPGRREGSEEEEPTRRNGDAAAARGRNIRTPYGSIAQRRRMQQEAAAALATEWNGTASQHAH